LEITPNLLFSPSHGLVPKRIPEIFGILEQLRDAGVTILLVEQKASMALSVSETCYLMEKGKIVFRGASKELTDNNAVSEEFLGV
jgi:branched-chain amino acid transport system ATP-binding protein